MKKYIKLLLAMLAILLLGAGCTTTNNTVEDELPWNSPASWEGQTMGLPY